MLKRPFIFLVLALLVLVFYLRLDEEVLTLHGMQSRLGEIQLLFLQRPILVVSVFSGTFLLLTGMAIPGSIFLTLLGGAVFGGVEGALLVNLLGSAGGLISFWLARFFLRDFVAMKFAREIKRMDGRVSLFTLRLVPASPFVVINLVAGLTQMRAWDFFLITFVGMLPGNLVFSFAGKRLMEIEKVSEILTGPLILILLMIGLVPWVVKRWMSQRHHAL